jgi:hypothetical protein
MRHACTFNIEENVKKDSQSGGSYDENVVYSEIFRTIAIKTGLPAVEDVVGLPILNPKP